MTDFRTDKDEVRAHAFEGTSFQPLPSQPMPPQQDVVYRVAPADITEGPFFLTPHIEQEECPLEYQFCRHCGEHAIFLQTDKGEWLSECCDAAPKSVDIERDDYYDATRNWREDEKEARE